MRLEFDALVDFEGDQSAQDLRNAIRNQVGCGQFTSCCHDDRNCGVDMSAANTTHQEDQESKRGTNGKGVPGGEDDIDKECGSEKFDNVLLHSPKCLLYDIF